MPLYTSFFGRLGERVRAAKQWSTLQEVSFLQGLLGPPDVESLSAKRDVRGLVKALQWGRRGTMTANVRGTAAKALGEIGDKRAVEPLIAALKLGFPWEAAMALAQIGDTRAIQPLIDRLGVGAPGLQMWVRHALGRFGPAAVDPLVEALGDHKKCDYAAKGLGQIGDIRAVAPLLVWSGRRPSDSFRKTVLAALVQIGQPAIQPLIEALKGGDSSAKSTAIVALGRIGGDKAVAALVAALESRDSDVRHLAAQVLGEMGDVSAVAALSFALQDGDPKIRLAAVEALTKLGDPRAVEPLVAMLKDKDGQMRKMAAAALMHLDAPLDPDSRAWLAVVMKDWKTAIGLGASAVRPLAAALRDGDHVVRKAAAEAFNAPGCLFGRRHTSLASCGHERLESGG